MGSELLNQNDKESRALDFLVENFLGNHQSFSQESMRAIIEETVHAAIEEDFLPQNNNALKKIESSGSSVEFQELENHKNQRYSQIVSGLVGYISNKQDERDFYKKLHNKIDEQIARYLPKNQVKVEAAAVMVEKSERQK